jgi:hypothetical protein
LAIENYLLGVGCFGAQIRHYEGLSQVLIKSCMLRWGLIEPTCCENHSWLWNKKDRTKMENDA